MQIRFPGLIAVLVLLCALFPSFAAQVIPVTVYDQKVAEVNGEAISKREVEEKMPLGMADQLAGIKRRKQLDGTWDAKVESEWMGLYVPAFKDALRQAIRERLMTQYFKFDKMTLEDKDFQKRVATARDQLMKDPSSRTEFTLPDIERRIREAMQIEEFQQTKFYNPLDFPKRPEVEQDYREHIEQHQRKAGMKIRIIRVDRKVIDRYTGVQKIRENPFNLIDEIRNNIVQFGASFAEEAKNKSDDDSRERGGLLQSANGDPFVIPEETNKVIASAVSKLKVGEVSPVVEYGADSYAIVTVEDKRDAGPAPLEGKLYDELYGKLLKKRSLKREDEWLRATLAKSLIINSTDNQVLNMEFFFPDDKKKTPDFAAQKVPVSTEKK